jgi:hypothetical protein
MSTHAVPSAPCTRPPSPPVAHTHTHASSLAGGGGGGGGGGSWGGGGCGEMRALPHDAQRDTRGHARGVQRKSVSASQMQVSPLPTALSKMPAEVTLQPVACPCLAPCAPPCSPFLMISRSCPSLPSLAPTQRSFSTMRFDAISYSFLAARSPPRARQQLAAALVFVDAHCMLFHGPVHFSRVFLLCRTHQPPCLVLKLFYLHGYISCSFHSPRPAPVPLSPSPYASTHHHALIEPPPHRNLTPPAGCPRYR